MIANRFPIKQAWDMAALGRLAVTGRLQIDDGHIVRLDFAQRLDCIRFYLTGHGIRNLYATMGRAGWHWSLLGVQLAMDLKDGGSGDYFYKESFWVPAANRFRFTELEWRHAFANDYLAAPIQDPVLFHTQHPYFRLRTRSLKSMRTVVVVRNIVKSVESNYFKAARVPDQPDAGDGLRFDWAHYARTAIEFTNSWGDAQRWHPSLRVYRYEDIIADPVPAMQEITDIWGLDLPTECLQEAFSRITKAAMKAKLEDQGVTVQQRVSFRGAVAAAPAVGIERIKHVINENLNHDFGYDYG